jgi:3',5'-cyclic-AMP phosphodiesterase
VLVAWHALGTLARVRVLQVSDIHAVAEPGQRVYGQASEVNLAAVLGAARDRGEYDVVIATGDVTDDASPAAYHRVALELEEFASTFRWIPGNHDDPRRMDARNRLRTVTDLGSWRLVTIDTRWEGHDTGKIGNDEFDRLRTVLAASDDRHVLIALHHPPVGLCSNPDCNLSDAGALLDLLEGHHWIRAVISGHVHAPFDVKRGALRLLGAPSTCVGMRHDACVTDHSDAPDTTDTSPYTDDPPAARILELADDGSIATRLISAE